MGKGSKAPKPADPRETSAAATGTNVGTAIANAYLQNPDQITPLGNLTYDLDASNAYEYTDPFTGQTYSIPKLTATQTLTDQGQIVNDNTAQTQVNLSDLAQQQSAGLVDHMADPFSYNPGKHEDWALGLYGQLNNGDIDRQRESLRTQLANQGLGMGTEAYSRAMGDFDTSQMDSRNKFLLDSYGTGMQTALTERNQPINEISALMGGSQVSSPNFVNANVSGIPTTDNAAIINNYDNQRMNQWQQNQAASGAGWSALGGLFQAGIGLL